MGNRWIEKELRHIVNFETWGVLVDEPGWQKEVTVFDFLWWSGERINAFLKVLMSRLFLLRWICGGLVSSSQQRKNVETVHVARPRKWQWPFKLLTKQRSRLGVAIAFYATGWFLHTLLSSFPKRKRIDNEFVCSFALLVLFCFSRWMIIGPSRWSKLTAIESRNYYCSKK